jgi:hypothetical protein
MMFRDLYDLFRTRDPRPLYWYRLVPWLEAHRDEIAWLRAFAERPELALVGEEQTALWHLYAVSRANDRLLWQLGPRHPGGEPAALSREEYLNFMIGLGFEVASEPVFSPFFHEIVEVEPVTDANAPITLGGEYWPPLMLGSMMFSRGGAYVSGGRNHIRKEIAGTSTVYWTHARRDRPCNDLSVGWGSQSQWRTSFRRDYRVGDTLVYNFDGACDLAAAPPDPARHPLTHSEMIELVTHRCLITVDRPDDDLYPYGFRYAVLS